MLEAVKLLEEISSESLGLLGVSFSSLNMLRMRKARPVDAHSVSMASRVWPLGH